VERVIDLALSDEQVAEMIRAFKWPRAITCPRCGSANVKRNGKSDKRPGVQRYLCKDCGKSFSDVTVPLFQLLDDSFTHCSVVLSLMKYF